MLLELRKWHNKCGCHLISDICALGVLVSVVPLRRHPRPTSSCGMRTTHTPSTED